MFDANNIWCSQAVTHPSTNQTQRCLTSLIGREAVCSTWYGRWHQQTDESGYSIYATYNYKRLQCFARIRLCMKT